MNDKAYYATEGSGSVAYYMTGTPAPAPDTTSPGIPGSFTASVTGRQVALTWAAETDKVAANGTADTYVLTSSGTGLAQAAMWNASVFRAPTQGGSVEGTIEA